MRGIILIILAATLWGTTGTSQALAPQGVTPIAIGTMRLVVGGIALLGLASVRGQIHLSRAWLRPAMVFSAVSVAIYQMTFFAGVNLAGVAVGTMVGIGSAPIFAGMLGFLLGGEKISTRWILATSLAVIGCVILALSGETDAQINPLGLLLALGAGLSYAIFTYANKQLVADFSPDAVMGVSFSVGALLLLPSLLFVDTRWIATTGGLVVVLHLGLIATGLSYMLYGRGLKTVPVSTTGTLTLAEPLTAATLGILVLGERMTLLGIIGIVVLFAGLLVLIMPSKDNFTTNSIFHHKGTKNTEKKI